MRTLVRIAVFVVAGITAASAQQDREWTQWRGPNRDGVLSAAHVPAAWPGSFQRSWSVDVGEGYSSPVVSGRLAFVHSRKDPQEVITAVDVITGAVKWQQAYAAPINKNGYAAAMGKGPNATPLVAAGRVLTLGASGIAMALDAASGKILWTRDYSSRIDTSKLFCGTAASPVLAAGYVVLQVGSDVHGGLVTALDPATGATRWEWKGDGPGYASPILVTVDKMQQLITLTNKSVVSLEAATGRQLWSIPFPDEWHENIVTPVWTGRELVVAGVRQGTRAFRLAGNRAPAEIWKNADVTMYMSSPVAGDGVIYGLSNKRKGQFVALDAATGTLKWATEGREGDQAAVLLAPSHVLFLTNTGTLVVAKRSAAGFQQEKRYTLSDSVETWTTPVFVGGSILLRDARSLTRLEPK